MHRAVCDLDSVWDQADGEPQRVAGAERGAGGDFVLQVVLQGLRKIEFRGAPNTDNHTTGNRNLIFHVEKSK